jgi:chromosome segregation ATPase|tara:strand:+ start:1326 stop:1754 length:429 start_codon:yes stop_codon:yes gene_type:complete
MSNNKEKILALDEKLSSQRTSWSKNIKELAQALRDINAMESTISGVLSSRQTMVEQIAYLNTKVREQKNNINSRWRESYIKYFEYDYKLGEKQKERFIENDLVQEHTKLSLLENQLDFMKESVKTLDNMGFAIRNRLALKDL